MIKNTIRFSFLLMGVFFLSACATQNQTPPPAAQDTSKPILFYSDSCPHCKIVEQFMTDNKVQDKIDLDNKEVSKDKVAAQELVDKAKGCQLEYNSIGVPLLWVNNKCLIGDQDIIDFFKTELNIK